MTCRHCVDNLLDYAEARLPRTEMAAFREHLVNCEPCNNLLVRYVKLPQLCAQTFMVPAPKNLTAQIMAFVH